MKMHNSKVILILVSCWLSVDSGAAEFSPLENAKKLYFIGRTKEALEMCRGAAQKGDIDAQLQLTEWLFAKGSKNKSPSKSRPDQPFQKPEMDIDRVDDHKKRLEQAVAGGEKPNPSGEKPNPSGEKPNPSGEKPNPGGEKPNPGGEKPNPGGEKPKVGVGIPVGKTGQFSPGGT
jgi:hypothetical protein